MVYSFAPPLIFILYITGFQPQDSFLVHSQNSFLVHCNNISHRVPGQGGSGGAQNSAPAVSLLNQFLFHYFTFHYDRSDDA